MPHDQEASTYDLTKNSEYNDDAWRAKNKDPFQLDKPIDQPLIEWLYHREELCQEKVEAVPWCMAKRRMYLFCAFKRDVEAMRQVIVTFDALSQFLATIT